MRAFRPASQRPVPPPGGIGLLPRIRASVPAQERHHVRDVLLGALPALALWIALRRGSGAGLRGPLLLLDALPIALGFALGVLATGRPVRGEVGMTGEVSLTGRVLPIGGVKQKLLAAQRAGLTEVFLPQRNEPDLDDVPADVLDALTVHLVSDVREVVAKALEAATPATVAA